MGVRDFFNRLTRSVEREERSIIPPGQPWGPKLDETTQDLVWAMKAIRKLNRRRKQITRKMKRALALNGEYKLNLNAASQQHAIDANRIQELERQERFLTAAVMKNVGDSFNYRRAYEGIMDRVFALGLAAGTHETKGEPDMVERCRAELRDLLHEMALLTERCFCCGGIKNLRSFHFTTRMALIMTPPGGTEGIKLMGDGRDHAICEVCQFKLMAGRT